MSAENGMFLSKFKKCKGYREEVLESCKWHVINNILILRCSEPDMQFISPFLAKVLIWVNFHHIPVDTGSMSNRVVLLGETIKNGICEVVCVQVDQQADFPKVVSV